MIQQSQQSIIDSVNNNQLNDAQELTLDIRPADDRSKMLELWKQLDDRLPDVSLTCSYLWIKNWLDHYGDIVNHRFAIAVYQGQQVGVALLTEGKYKNGPFRIRSLHLGTAAEPEADSACVEYNNLLISNTLRSAFGVALLSFFNTEQEWDEFCIDGWNQEELNKVFGNEINNWTMRLSRSFYHDLNETRNLKVTPVSRMGKSTKKAISRNRNSYGDTHTEWAETVEQGLDIFNDLIKLHQSRWNAIGKPGSYSSKRFLHFHQSLIHDLIPTKQMGMFRVSNKEGLIGCAQMMFDNNRVLIYQSGCAQYTSKNSPGLITDYLCLEASLERGYDAYDLLGGETHHKERLSTNFNTLVWATYRRKRLKFQISNLLRKCKRSVLFNK